MVAKPMQMKEIYDENHKIISLTGSLSQDSLQYS